MFKHSTGWDLNARILRLFLEDHFGDQYVYLFRIVREEIAQDRQLVWC